MIDLRFVEREVPDWVKHDMAVMKKVKILQFRESTNDYEIANEMEYMPNWTEWADVPTEREDDG